MIYPTEDDIDKTVVYTGNYGGPLEVGKITSFNEGRVFVQYKGGCTSKSTRREDLEWQFSRENK